jgi:Protein of unknown function DUF115
MENKNKLFSPIGNLYHTTLSVLKILLKSKLSVQLPMASSDTCIVLGNGPSLKTSLEKHPAFFSKHPLLCVNSFAVTSEYKLLQPEYYVMLDPSWWKGENELLIKTIEAIKRDTTWPIILLLPQQAKGATKLIALQQGNKNISIVFFNYTVYTGLQGIGHWLFKKNLAMPQSQNVLVASLFLPINMGFKHIYLFGADHTWHETLYVNDDNVLCLKHVHFYEKEKEIKHVPFYKGVHLKETFTMREIMYTFAKVFAGYERLRNYANARNCTIYNASEVSFIDAFERKKIID